MTRADRFAPRALAARAALLLPLLCALGCGDEPTPPAVEPERPIVFRSSRTGGFDVYSVRADGSELTRLTDDPLVDYHPMLSPDGRRIAWGSSMNGAFYDIHVMNADGSEKRRVTSTADSEDWPSWSPDGSRLLFNSKASGHDEIYVINVDGTGLRRLTTTAATVANAEAEFSPDGTKIVYVATADERSDVYVMNADGSDARRLTDAAAGTGGGGPAWSPDGQWIAFSSRRSGNVDVYRMRADGSQVTRLTTDAASDFAPTFSRSGPPRIAFVTDRNGIGTDWDIYVMGLDGGAQTPLVRSPHVDHNPSW